MGSKDSRLRKLFEMTFLEPSCAWRWAGLVALSGLLAGCASPGVPRPPSLQLPEKSTLLTAQRIGAQVQLTWNTPANTTDGGAIRGGISAALCRQVGIGPCVGFRQMAVQPGATAASDTLPGPLRVGTDSLLAYRVELKNDKGRSDGVSEPAFAAGGRAPEMPAEVSAEVKRKGVLITWQPEVGGAAGAVVELRRTGSTAPKAQKILPTGQKAKPSDGSIILIADNATSGMVDRSVKSGETYTYLAQRVRQVLVAGHALELRSPAATPVTITYRDTFAPQPPTGLATVPGGGFGAAASIDLSWQPSEEADLLGYNVYRSVDGGAPARVTEKPIPDAAYRDLQVTPGHRYAYRVTAVDTHGNESLPSAEARETSR